MNIYATKGNNEKINIIVEGNEGSILVDLQHLLQSKLYREGMPITEDNRIV